MDNTPKWEPTPATITLPADLGLPGAGGPWTPDRLEDYADILNKEDGRAAGPALLRALAATIHEQTKPARPEGWYALSRPDHPNLMRYWRGAWFQREGGPKSGIDETYYTVRPVTMGDPE